MVIPFLIFSNKNLKEKNNKKKVNMSPFLMKFIKKFKRTSANFLNKNKEDIFKGNKTVIFILFLVKVSQDDLCTYLLGINFESGVIGSE